MNIIIGFRDPNSVPIRDFYESSYNINYFAIFVNHTHYDVRDAFFRMIGDLLCRLPDRVDHETRLVPYLLSGYFDEND